MSEILIESKEVCFEDLDNFIEFKSDLSLFKIKISAFYPFTAQLSIYLSSAELKHSQQYHFEKDANRYIICRVLLKFILARRLSIPVSEINIALNHNKKPYLVNDNSVFFNLSHSKDLAIIAVSDNAVGIDLEYLNNNFDFMDMLPTIFSSKEIERVLTTTQKAQTFFKYWTRKEAIVKATGQGISDDLPKIPATDGRHTIDSDLLEGYNNLFIYSFPLDEDYVTAVALSKNKVSDNKLLIYNLPSSLETPTSFIHLNHL